MVWTGLKFTYDSVSKTANSETRLVSLDIIGVKDANMFALGMTGCTLMGFIIFTLFNIDFIRHYIKLTKKTYDLLQRAMKGQGKHA